MRLHKYLASCGVCSRRKAEELIAGGRVLVNGNRVVALGSLVDEAADIVLLDGKRVSSERRRLWVFYKPKGVLSTMSDPQRRPCLSDYTKILPVRVFPVGRLDVDVSGLVLLTNDGAFCERMLHPRYEVPRTYWAKVTGSLSAESIRLLREGVELSDGPGRALSARVLRPSAKVEGVLGPYVGKSSYIELVVAEGRNHFVKRLLESVGNPVLSLSRVSFGGFTLARLLPGKIREILHYEARLEAKKQEGPARQIPGKRLKRAHS
jgi:23S rRNA pseudouridine2605 synthase